MCGVAIVSVYRQIFVPDTVKGLVDVQKDSYGIHLFDCCDRKLVDDTDWLKHIECSLRSLNSSLWVKEFNSGAIRACRNRWNTFKVTGSREIRR